MRKTWGMLAALLLVACSAISEKSDTEQGSQADEAGRPSDETEGVLGYLRTPELVSFDRQNFLMTVTGQPGAIVAEDLDVRTLFVHIIQIPIEELQQAKTTLQSDVQAVESSQAPEDSSGAVANEDMAAEQKSSIDPDDGKLVAPDPNDSADNGPDVGTEPPPLDEPNMGSDEGTALTYRLAEFSPSELIVKGRIRGSLHPNSDGSFNMEVSLTRPDPVVLVVGMFDAIDLISVKEITDPRVSTIIYSPADTKISFLDESYISSVDVQQQIEAFANTEEEWLAKKPMEAPQNQIMDDGPVAENPYLPAQITDDGDAQLDGDWSSRCQPSSHGFYTSYFLRFRADGDLAVQQVWATDEQCMQPFAYVDGRGRYGSAANEGVPYKTMTTAMLNTSIVPLIAKYVDQLFPLGTCSEQPWEDGQFQSADYNPKEGANFYKCSTSFAPLAKLSYLNYYITGSNTLKLSNLGVRDPNSLGTEFPIEFKKDSF